jgi:hypothetical protein
MYFLVNLFLIDFHVSIKTVSNKNRWGENEYTKTRISMEKQVKIIPLPWHILSS